MTMGGAGAAEGAHAARERRCTPRARRDFFLVSAAAALAAAFIFAFDPAENGIYPPCLMHLLTGLHCPGCGSLRAIHSMLHGRFIAAAGFNLLAVCLTPYLVWEYVSLALSAFRGRGLPRPFSSRAGAWLLVGAIAAFAIVRNIPVYPFNVLAP